MFALRVLALTSLLGLGCGAGAQTSADLAGSSPPAVHPDAASPPPTTVDAGQPPANPDAAGPTAGPDAARPAAGADAGPPAPPAGAGRAAATPDAMAASVCGLPPAPPDLCAALPVGTISPCSQSGGQPSQTGYLQIETGGGSPSYVCATSWSADPSVGYIFGQPGTFMSEPQSCCGGSASTAPAPTAPVLPIGSIGTLHIPSHVKPQEMEQPGSGAIRQNPFAVVVTDPASGAAATAAMSRWTAWGGDRQPHAAPDGSGTYYFASGFPINYVVLETSAGFPVIVIGPEVSPTSDGKNPLGHPTLGACPAGGGAPLAMIGGEVHGTTLNNQSGRYDYGPSATAETLQTAAALFNCMGIPITGTQFTAPKP